MLSKNKIKSSCLLEKELEIDSNKGYIPKILQRAKYQGWGGGPLLPSLSTVIEGLKTQTLSATQYSLARMPHKLRLSSSFATLTP